MELKTKEKILGWLLKYGIEAERIHEIPENQIQQADSDIQELLRNIIIIPYVIELHGQDSLFKATISWSERWIQIKLLLQSALENVSVELERDLYAALLEANFELMEVTFSRSPYDGGVYVEADMPVESTYENFESEYSAIEGGADYFLNQLIPKLVAGITPKPTYDGE